MSYTNNNSHFLNVFVPSPLYRSFDYLLPEGCDVNKLLPGMRVAVPFGSQTLVGILAKVTKTTDVPVAKLKRAYKILDDEPVFSPSTFSLLLWAAEYYHYPIGEVFATALPKFLRLAKSQASLLTGLDDFLAKLKNEYDLKLKQPPHQLNDYQELARKTIAAHLTDHKAFLIDGVTGSGKTEVYLQLITEVLKQNRQALILIPEISLTPQTIDRFKKRFQEPIAVFHSRLADKEKFYYWHLAASGLARIVIGTRSAVFTPLKNPGLIILDEEHDLSFKQQSSFRYSARTIAMKRGELENVPVILGSATPSLPTLHLAKSGQYEHLILPIRAGGAAFPTFHLLDMKGIRLKSGFHPELLHVLGTHLMAGNQVLVFLNRRGYAPTIMCHTCGWCAMCANCDVRLTLHQNPSYLSCHHCGKREAVPTLCPKCQSNNLLALGLGTERAEILLKKLFAGVDVIRIDRDTTRNKGALQNLLTEIKSGGAKILLGTQMLTKGHDFPDVTLVAVLNADSGLFSADFQASEYVAQLIVQVAGRAGRAQKPGQVYIQSYHPDHPLLQSLVNGGYGAFSKRALAERQEGKLPPYACLAILRAENKSEAAALEFLNKVRTFAEDAQVVNVKVMGPVKALIGRKAGVHRAQLWIESCDRQQLDLVLLKIIAHIAISKISGRSKWHIDVDPVETGN